MKILHIDSSILGDHSVSRHLSAAVVDRLKQANPGASLTYRDLAARPLPHLGGAHLAASQMPADQIDPAIAAEVAAGEAALTEFLDADAVVIGSPMYNFTVSSQLKAWIDRLAVAGRTFRYTETGSVGLAGGKRVIVVASRGGFYAAGTPTESFEHQESYLRAVLSFFGITDVTFVAAEGIAIGPEAREQAIADALAKIDRLEPLAAAA